ncbi:MAG: DUF4350 domain-containing protein [Desulfobulbaceae bacterium]|uniref:DUF4350 domain-containing protein n=1 Tax=Candidatus Desulfobia pelagia TaxID=2841692 RepID=A0A8J6TF75_9BACT|nr:DUF4350 domain-containing protein [Candidatus Desulfobia pelagia]
MIKERKIVFSLLFTVLLLLPVNALAESIVLFDQGHGQQFLVENNRPLDLSELATLFINEGATITTSKEQLSTDILQGVDTLIISGPFVPLTGPEVHAILQFVQQGGNLALMAHIAQPIAGIIKMLGGVISSAAVYEQKNIIGGNPRDFMVNKLAEHPLTNGLDAFAAYGTWALMAEKEGTKEIASTSEDSWVDLNMNGVLNDRDAKQSFALILAGNMGMGKFVIFGDDALFQNQFLQGGNRILGQNLARWFTQNRQQI